MTTTNTTHLRSAVALTLLVAIAAPAPMALTSCASKEGGAGLGAALGAVAGAAAGYAISGDAEGALVGAAAGAAVGAAAGWALSDKKEKQVASPEQVRQQLPPEEKAVIEENARPIVEVRDLAVTPLQATAGQPVTVAVMMRAVPNATSSILPPSAKVDVVRDGTILKTEMIETTQVGDSELSFTLPIPEAAEEGVYVVAVTAVPHPTTINPYPEESTKAAELYVNPAPVAKRTAPPAGTEVVVAAAAPTE